MKCNGKLVDPRTKTIHEVSEISEESIESSQNRQEIEEINQNYEGLSSKTTSISQDVNLLEIDDDEPNLAFLPRTRSKRYTNQQFSTEITTETSVIPNITKEDEVSDGSSK